MDSVLLISSRNKGVEVLSALLKAAGITAVSTADSGSMARRMLIQNEYDLVLINAPLSDGTGEDLAMEIARNTLSGVLLFVRNEMADHISEKVENDGVLVVGKPLMKPLFYQALRLAQAGRRRIAGLKDENIRLKNQIDEIRLVNRAKCVLIEYLKMTEPQAHRYIEKQAMDLRLTRREIALNILKTYES